MSFWIRVLSGVLAIWFGMALGGCTPGQNQADDEREPHFVLGKSRVNAMDYQGAVEAFEQSLEVNPRSAAAHFELGWLYEQKVPDPAAAIYHYQQYLKLNPNAGNAAVIKQHIEACKQQLAADVMPLPSTPAAQEQLEKLMEQNRQLQAQVDHLKDLVKQWINYANQLAARTNAIPVQPSPAASQALNPIEPTRPAPTAPAQSAAAQPAAAAPRAAPPRTHSVIAGETAMAICRKTGVKFSALERANPGVNLSRIRVGQVLNLPPP
jgi:tetratricopeptide (TPR) repeat protein